MLKTWMEKNDISLDEEFKFEMADSSIYRLHDVNGDIVVQKKDVNGIWIYSDISANKFCNLGVIKFPWKPEEGDKFYTIRLEYKDVCSRYWTANYYQQNLYDLGLVCKTKEEAERKLNKLIEFCKKELYTC